MKRGPPLHSTASSVPSRVGVVKTLHIPANVLFDMVEQFMASKGLDTAGYEFVQWDVQHGADVESETTHNCNWVFRGVILQKTVVKQLFDAEEDEEDGHQ